MTFSEEMEKIFSNRIFTLFSMLLLLSTNKHMIYSEWEYIMRRRKLSGMNSEGYREVYIFFYTL